MENCALFRLQNSKLKSNLLPSTKLYYNLKLKKIHKRPYTQWFYSRYLSKHQKKKMADLEVELSEKIIKILSDF